MCSLINIICYLLLMFTCILFYFIVFYVTAQADRFVVAKLQRDELEDRYIVVSNENVSLKRLMNELRKQVQR